MDDYIKVDIVNYVKDGIKNGTLIPKEAYKYTRIVARPGVVGETVISWSEDSSGNEVKEKVALVEVDELSNIPGWVVTKVDINGNLIIDRNGHYNEWIIDNKTFNKKYEIDPMNPSLFRPKGGNQMFVQINENIILNQWGNDMKIAKGGFINITDIDDMYGISQRDFEDTYKFVECELVNTFVLK